MSENTLLVPGLHNSGPEHWQSHWHQRFPHWRRVTEQRWSEPDLVSWSDKVAQHLAAASDKIHLVAHSFGTLASIAAARRHADKVEPKGTPTLTKCLKRPYSQFHQAYSKRNRFICT